MELTLNFTLYADALPEKSGECVCIMKHNYITTMNYSAKHKMFNVYDFTDSKYAESNNLNDSVIAWARLPKEKLV